MICALIGDRTIGNLAEGHLEDRLRVLIEERHVSAFVMGYFGPFERLALRVIRRLQQDYPLLDYTVILCGPRKETPADPELDYLHTLYPQGCWLWPGRIGLTRKLCYLASASDMIAYMTIRSSAEPQAGCVGQHGESGYAIQHLSNPQVCTCLLLRYNKSVFQVRAVSGRSR